MAPNSDIHTVHQSRITDASSLALCALYAPNSMCRKHLAVGDTVYASEATQDMEIMQIWLCTLATP